MFETELDHDGNGKLEGSEIFDLESQEKSLREQAEREVRLEAGSGTRLPFHRKLL